ncbi:hypothetical protein C4546_02315 [Candidatus Parcubacteria bacterium]|jgi:hypothetical protein|nr:MAG: hypothetical protein C4546_02315 [Candidatus Parcubacteria bacterium]
MFFLLKSFKAIVLSKAKLVKQAFHVAIGPLLTFVGFYLISQHLTPNGYLEHATWDAFVGALLLAAGLITTIVSTTRWP